MSDSDLSDALSAAVPPDATLEKELRKQVATQYGSDGMTTNTVRKAVEEVLGLAAGYFKNHDRWKEESKTIIKDAVAKQEAPASSPTVAAKPSPAKPPPARPSKKSPPAKRPSQSVESSDKKRRKKLQTADDSEDELSSPPADLSSAESEPKPRKAAAKRKAKAATNKAPTATSKSTKSKAKPKPKPEPRKKGSENELSDAPDEKSEGPAKARKPEEDSGSELSVLLDDKPKPKKRQKSKDLSEKTAKKSDSKPAAEADLDQEEIKRLQGWLVKCGIRKLWGKELKPYEASKAKIKHLRDMLSDAGMTGRYSQEKANQIKEARELAADIEAVQEGAERWGKTDDEEGGGGAKEGEGKRRLVRGAKHYDFLSSDGEETD